MSNLTLRKFNKIMDHRDSIQSEGARGISSLASSVGKAIEFCILLEEDPDGYFATNGDKEEIRQDFTSVMNSLNEVLPTIALIEQLRNEAITVEQFRTSTGKEGFDVQAYQDSLTS